MTASPTTLSPSASLERAARELALGAFRHLPVVDEAGKLLGLVSERDLLVTQELHGQVSDLMVSDVVTVSPDTPAHEAAYLLLRKRIGCLPVTDEHGTLVGIVTESDFVRVAYTLLGGRIPVDQLELEETEADRV